MCARDKITDGIETVLPNGMTHKIKMSRIAQYYRLKQKHSLMRGEIGMKSVPVYSPDWLAVMTAYTKTIFEILVQFSVKLRTAASRYVPNLSGVKKYTIPAVILLVALLVYRKQNNTTYEDNKFWKTLYLLSFAIHFGAQFWMTFVSGIVLYFSIPRHVFGQVQEVLFPFYYLFNAVMSLIWVVSFINTQQSIPLHSDIFKQVFALTACHCIEMHIRLYVARVVVMLKQKKTKIESEAGMGMEVGHQILGELKNCPHYMGILKSFRRMHSYTSVATIITVVCSLYHLNYLLDKLCV